MTMMSSDDKRYQADQLDHPESIAACAKHFAGYGAGEGGRDYNSTFISERWLRNLYLRPFEAAVDAGCATFMTSFTDNDGVLSGDIFYYANYCVKSGGMRYGRLGLEVYFRDGQTCFAK